MYDEENVYTRSQLSNKQSSAGHIISNLREFFLSQWIYDVNTHGFPYFTRHFAEDIDLKTTNH